jgi:type II secretory pathway component PulF
VSAGCPEPFPTVLRQATGEADLPSLLTRRLLAIQDRLIRRAEVRLRLAQPLALATAGVTVMWLVVRVVLPVITHRMEGLQP